MRTHAVTDKKNTVIIRGTDLFIGGEILVDDCSSIEEGITIFSQNSIHQLYKYNLVICILIFRVSLKRE